MHRKSVGYGPSRLAVVGLAGSAAALLLPVLGVDLAAGPLLLALGGWLLVGAYVWYAVNIYDLRKTEQRITAVQMLTIPIAVVWVGTRFLDMLGADPVGAAIVLLPALAIGAISSFIALWLLSTLRQGALRLVGRHERRRRWPSVPWVVGSILAVSLVALASTASLPGTGDPAGLIRSVSEGLEIPELPQDPGIALSTTGRPVTAAPTLVSRQAAPAPSRAADPPITIARARATARQSAVDTAAIEQAVFSLTNQERQAQGLPALQWDAALASIARAHSQDMAANNYMSHTNLRGQDPTARAVAAGYQVRRSMGGGWYTAGIGENINMMPTGNVVGHGYVNNDPQSVARAMVQGWMNSPGHRENILRAQYARIGVGVAYDGTLYYYGTQNFI